MNKTIFLGLLLVLLLGIIGIFAWQRSSEQSALEDYEGNFAIANIDDIGKIVLSHRTGEVYTLTRDGAGWIVNDTYPVRMSSMVPLLDAMKLVQIRYIPGEKAHDNVMENIEAIWIHVDVLDRSGKKLKSYRVGGVTQDERGTYMVMDGSNQPFVVHIPSWDGALRSRYTLVLADWRDRHFMNITPEEITAVQVEYPQQKSQSFLLTRSEPGFKITPVFPDLRDYPKGYNEGSAEAFLKALSEAACEGYENQYYRIDSIRNLVPFCHMQITLSGSATPLDLRIWPKGVPVYTPNSPPVHRLFIDKSPGDFLLVQYDVIKGMLRGYDFFTGTETTLVF